MGAAKVSKNAREGVRAKSKKHFCAKGHELVILLLARNGRRLMTAGCACSGYEPLNMSLPYKYLSAKSKQTKARIYFERLEVAA